MTNEQYQEIRSIEREDTLLDLHERKQHTPLTPIPRWDNSIIDLHLPEDEQP